MKLDPFAQFELPRKVVHNPVGLRQERLDLDLRVSLKESVKNLQVNIPGRSLHVVLRVHGRGIHALNNHDGVFISGRKGYTKASEHQQHNEEEDQSLFHKTILLSDFFVSIL
jgi:hypothetical protein